MNTPEPDFIEADEVLESLFYALKHSEFPASLLQIMERIRSIYIRGSESTRYKILTDLIEMEFIGAKTLLIDALINDESPLIRHEAAFGLGVMGKRSDQVELTKALLYDPHEMVRHEAAIALAEIGGEESLPALEKATKDPSVAVASSARYAIQSLYLKTHYVQGVANV